MAYRRSVREIPLDENPLAEAIEAVVPDDDSAEPDWDNASAFQLKLLALHPEARLIVGSPLDTPTLNSDGGGEIGG